MEISRRDCAGMKWRGLAAPTQKQSLLAHKCSNPSSWSFFITLSMLCLVDSLHLAGTLLLEEGAKSCLHFPQVPSQLRGFPDSGSCGVKESPRFWVLDKDF